MAIRTPANSESLGWVDALLNAEIENVRLLRTADTVETVAEQVRSAFRSGFSLALDFVDFAINDTVRQRLHRVKRGRRVSATLENGERIDVQEYIGVAVETEDGVEHVQMCWDEMLWPQVIQTSQLRSARARRAVNEEVLWDLRVKLYQRYPQTRCPREACQLAGLDPNNLDARVINGWPTTGAAK